jgi:UDP-N-acetylmuramoylalanine--D-glutamate ligase
MHNSGKHVLVLGLGESGLAMARWLTRCGARVRVADTRAMPERLPQLRTFAPEAEFVAGMFNDDLLASIDLIAVSPGLSPLHELASIVAAAKQAAIPIVGEIELFAQALIALQQEVGYAPKVIAITGTNGKTTVTRLTGLLCEKSGLRTQVAGNISPAVLDVLCNLLSDAEKAPPAQSSQSAQENTQDKTLQQSNASVLARLPQVWVLELSSFQLHHTHTLAPDAATILNITQDHLDWHGDFAAYKVAKAQVFLNAGARIVNRDDGAVVALSAQIPNRADAQTITFGADEADECDSFGLVNENGMLWLSMATLAADDQLKKRRKADLSLPPVLTTRLMPVDALKIRGRHNAVNALAALALCRAIGLPLAPLLHGLRDYAGEPHRVELIATIADVAFYDDSKGTNVGATVAALIGLGSQSMAPGIEQQKKIWLIAGGEGKGQDFTLLADPINRYARAVLLIGKDAAQIRAALDESATQLIDCASLEAATVYAATHAAAGDLVLLSPACASFDMFNSYIHRAQVFVDAVQEVALSRGEVLV